MDKVYLFGAGINAYGVISYIGKENIIAIIDNEKKKQGRSILEVPIISFESYLNKKNSNNEIVITAAVYDEIIKQLKNSNIQNFSMAPMITAGSILNPNEIVKYCKSLESIYLVGQNILTEKFCEYILKNKSDTKLYIVENEKKNSNLNKVEYVQYESIPNDADIILFKEDLSSIDKKNIVKFKNVHDIYELKDEKKYKRLKKYKDKYKGKKCFIVGNGPSLKISDLERIYKDKIDSFGLNLIYKIYSDTAWRPTFLAISDYTVYRAYYEELKKLDTKSMFIRDFYQIEGTPAIKDINYFPSSGKRDYYDMQKFSNDITKNVYSGYTVMYDAMQIAIYMGFSEIYLIGADFSYLGDVIQQGNHIYDYKEKDKRDVSGTIHIDVSLNAFMIAKKYAEDNNIKIYNATRGGKLEVFERKSLDELFEEIENNEV